MTTEETRLGLAAAAGDKDAYLSLYDQYITPIYRFVYFRVPSKERAEDLTSTVFLKAWKYRARFTPKHGGTYQSWLYTIARNTIIDSYRKEKDHDDLSMAAILGIQDEHADPHTIAQLVKAMRQLTEGQQDMLRLRFWHQLSYKEIAEVTGKRPAACRMQVSRAVSTLGTLLPADLLLLLCSIAWYE
jgi:RNA polymerase sigma-70 factor (ECF subfamily)